MKTYDAPSINIPSRGQRFILARRNCPEVIKPTAALPTAITPGAGWVLGTRQNVVTAVQFGNTPLILIGVGIMVNDGKTTAINLTLFIREEGQVRMYIDKNLGVGDELIAEFPWSSHGLLQVTGQSLDTISASVITLQQRRISLSHQLIAPYSLIRADATARLTPAATTQSIEVMPYFYTPSAYNLIEVALSEYDNELGNDSSVDYVRKTRCFPSLGAVNLGSTVGIWVEIDAALDADYLIEGWCAGSVDGTAGAWLEIDFAACPQGSLPAAENVQARAVVRRATFTQRLPGVQEEFFHPFVAYKGERLMAQITSQNNNPTPSVFLYGRRI